MTAAHDPIRPDSFAALEPSGISKVTALGLGNPDVLPLWFGETDLVTPPFIREAAVQALEDGKHLLHQCARHPALARGDPRFPQAHRRRGYRAGAHHRARRRDAGGGDARCRWCARPATMS